MPLFADLPPIQHERVACAIMASVKYQVPTNILLAIAEQEGGKPGIWVKNKNGTYDVGPMQFNTHYLKDLARFGITPDDVAVKGCYSYDLAAWRLRGHLLHDSHDIWTRAANYHSKTPKYNGIYRASLIKKADHWQHWLNIHFKTHHANTKGATPTLVQQRNKKVVHQDISVQHPTPHQPKTVPQHTIGNTEAEKALQRVFAPNRVGMPL